MRSWRETRPFDYIMLAAAIALTCYGLLLIYSGSINTMGTGLDNLQGPTGRQAVFGVIAVVVCLTVSRFDYRWLAQVYESVQPTGVRWRGRSRSSRTAIRSHTRSCESSIRARAAPRSSASPARREWESRAS